MFLGIAITTKNQHNNQRKYQNVADTWQWSEQPRTQDSNDSCKEITCTYNNQEHNKTQQK